MSEGFLVRPQKRLTVDLRKSDSRGEFHQWKREEGSRAETVTVNESDGGESVRGLGRRKQLAEKYWAWCDSKRASKSLDASRRLRKIPYLFSSFH